MAASPQRLEAAVDYAAVTARVELVPFPSVQNQEFFRNLRAPGYLVGPALTSYPEGTENHDKSGSPRTRFVTWSVTSPNCGLLRITERSICRSGEYQTSV